jgi:hypothetical protein
MNQKTARSGAVRVVNLSGRDPNRTILDFGNLQLNYEGCGHVEIMQRSGQVGIQAAEEIQRTVRQSTVVNSDETGARVDGQKTCEWVFCTLAAILYVIKPTRGTG